jgi:hypothetical protein
VLLLPAFDPMKIESEPVLLYAAPHPIPFALGAVLFVPASHPMKFEHLPTLFTAVDGPICTEPDAVLDTSAQLPIDIALALLNVILELTLRVGTKTVEFSLDRDSPVPPIIAELQLVVMVLPQPPIIED